MMNTFLIVLFKKKFYLNVYIIKSGVCVYIIVKKCKCLKNENMKI